MASKIEQLILQLEPKFLSQAQDYLEYLIFLQQQKRQNIKHTKNQKKNDKLNDLRHFKGDAPYPNVIVTKSDFYEQ
jgi:hypothetical protein